MKYMPVLLLALALMAAAPPQPTASRVEVTAVAVRATNEAHEGVVVDSSLRPLTETLEEFPYNTFRVLMPEKHAVLASGSDAVFNINDRYALTMTLLESHDSGRVRIRARIRETVQVGDKKIVRDALNTTCTILPKKHLLLGGLKLDEGELALILSVSPTGAPRNETAAKPSEE